MYTGKSGNKQKSQTKTEKKIPFKTYFHGGGIFVYAKTTHIKKSS